MGLEDRELVDAKNAPPEIVAPTPGGSSSVAGGSSPMPPSAAPQAPTGFGGPMPGENPSGSIQHVNSVRPEFPSSPIPEHLNLDQFSPETQAALRNQAASGTLSWRAEDVESAGLMVRGVFNDIDDATLNKVVNVIIATGDPSILQTSADKMLRKIGMTTEAMFTEDALVHMLGVPPDDEAFTQAAVDTYLETGGAAMTAATMLSSNEAQRTWWEKSFLEDRDVRQRIAEAAYDADEGAQFRYEQERAVNLASGLPEPLEPETAVISEINGLRGKTGVFMVDGNRLAMRFDAEDADDDGSWLSLILLDPGTEIETPEDAILAYLLAENGIAHHLDESSDDVPGRQTILGSMIEGFDDVLKSVERWGFGVDMEAMKDSQASVSNLMAPPGRTSRTIEGREAQEDAIREQETRAAVERNFRTDSIVAVMQQAAAEAPDAPMSNIVAAGMWAYNNTPDEIKEAAIVTQIEDLEAAAAAKQEEQSMLGRFIEEDVAPPVLDALAAWDAGIHFIGIVALDVTNNGILEFAREVDEKGLSALYDPESLVKLSPVDAEFVQEQMENVRTEGLPKAMDSYIESVDEIGTIANYYGIEEGSAWASWVNLGGSVLFDPITWVTLGGNASWNALKKGVFSAAGVERIVKSRPLLSAARNVVVNDSVRSLPVLSAGGMSSNAIRRLAKIAKTTYETRAAKVAAMEEVLDIFRLELPGGGAGGMWIPSGPAKVLRRKTTQGLAHLAGVAVKDPKARSFLQDILIRATRNRAVSIGERGWMDDLFNLVEIRRLDDVDGFADDIIAITDLYDAYRGGDDAVAILQGKVQAVRQEIVDISAGLTDEVRQVPGLRNIVIEWNDSIKALDERIAKTAADDPGMAALREAREKAIAARTEAEDLLKSYDGAVSISGDKATYLPGNPYDTYVKEIRARERALHRYEAQMTELGTVGRDRAVLEEATQRYMDEWAEEWGVPLLLDINGNTIDHPIFPTLKRRNWDDILGEGATASYYDDLENVGVLRPFGTEEEALRKLGMGPAAGQTVLPVSPQELLAWHTMTRTAAGRKAWEFFGRHPGFKKTGDAIQGFWSMSVLFSPRTAARSHLDEVVRFYEDSGMSMDLWRSTTPSRFPKGGVGPQARAFNRESMGSFASPGHAAWGMVSPSKRGMWQHAERWLNGSIVQDPLFRAYARAYMNGSDDAARRALWETWYNDKGIHLAKTATLNGDPITAAKAYDIMDGSFNKWLTGMKKTGKKGRLTQRQAHDDIIEAAANNQQLKWQPQQWRQLPDVPAENVAHGKNPIDGGFNLLYGKPQQRRGSVFYDHYYEWAYKNYRQAYEGKVVDADWLLNNGKAVDRLHAQEMMNQGHRNNVVRELINEAGMVLDDDLANAAMNWAAKGADDMMYTFGATSLLGKKMARIYPFGRAQVDYLQWWWKKLTQPTQLRLPGAGYQAGVVGGASRMASIGATGANLRLIDRMAHLANLGNDPNQGAMTPAGVINNWTFLPTTIDEQLVIETTPNLGPVPAWLLNAPLDDTVPGWTEARNVVQELHPAHRIFSDPAGDPVSWLISVRDALFPKGGLGVRNEIAAANDFAAMVFAMATLNYDPNLPLTDEQQRRVSQYANAWVLNSSLGPWRADYRMMDQAEWLDENALHSIPDLNPEGEIMMEWAFRNDAASVAALQEDAKDFARKIAGAAVVSGSDFQYVDSMLPVGEESWADEWLASGSITQEKRDAIMSGYELVTGDDSTADDRLAFADEVLDTIFHSLTDEERAEFLAKHPGMHINMVSSYEVKPSLVPLDAAADVNGYRIDTDNPTRARELRAQGRAEGWLKYRDDSEVRHDTLLSAHRTFRSYLDVIYEDATGQPFGARTIEIDGERIPLDEFDVTLTPEWWNQHGEWLERTGAFELSSTAKAALTAGRTFDMNMGELKETTRVAKGVYAYQLNVSSATEAKLNRIGLDSRPASNLVYELSKVEGFDTNDFDRSVDMKHYGADLMRDFDDALAAGQEYEGWESFEDWEHDTVMFEIETTDEFGEKTVEVKVYSKSDLQARFRVAVALSDEPNDVLQFTEDDYDNSIYGRELGELGWEPPDPPALSEVQAYHEASYDDLVIVDGDTIKIQGETSPVFVRLLGLNAPEKGQPGYDAAYRGIDRLLSNADKVQFVIFDPDRYGFKHSTLAREGGSIVHRDRLFVWLYVDGTPVFDPGQFSPTNIRGVATGGSVPQYEILYQNGKNAGGS